MFTLDEIYSMDFEQFCKETYTTPELFIKAIEAEIAILKRSYEINRQKLNSMLLTHPDRDRQEKLCIHIQSQLRKKQSKLKKYLRFVKKV